MMRLCHIELKQVQTILRYKYFPLAVFIFFFICNSTYAKSGTEFINVFVDFELKKKADIDSVTILLKNNLPSTEEEIGRVVDLLDKMIADAKRNNDYELLLYFIKKNRSVFSDMGANLLLLNSINYFLESTKPSGEQNEYYAEIMRIKGKIYDHIGLIDLSIKSFNEAMIFADKHDIYFTAIHSRIHLAYEYHHHKDNEIPIPVIRNLYKEAEQICIEQSLESNLPYVYSGLTNKGMGTIEQREEYFLKSIQVFKDSNRPTPYFIQLAFYQEFLFDEGRIHDTHALDSMIIEYTQADIEYRTPYINLLRIKGMVLVNNKKYKEAEEVLLTALDEATLASKSLEIKEVRLALAHCYSFYDHAKQSDQLKLILDLEESINDQKRHYLSELERIANQVSERELLIIEKDKNLRMHKNIQFMLSIFTLLAILSLATIYKLYSKNKKQNNLLQVSNNSLIAQNKLISEQEKILIQSNSELEKKKNNLDALNTELVHSQNLLLESNQNLSQFAHIAAHDLKAPLRNISSFVKLFLSKNKDKLNTGDFEMLSIVEDSAISLRKLIIDLLEFAQLNNGKAISIVSLNFLDLLKRCLIHLQMDIEEHNVIVNYSSDEIHVLSNDSLMFQLLTNLISNAIKFRRDDIQLVITIEWKSYSDTSYLISIQDNGIGISKENQADIFKPFNKLHSRHEYEGSGLGLATCAKIVEHLNGRLWVESELGEGASFYFTIPKATNV